MLNGEVDTIGTDHVHRTIDSKAGGIWAASPGCPGLETMLPVLLSEWHHKRGLSLERIAALTATNPARIMGLSHAKGSIALGLDADLALVDINASWLVERSNVLSSAGYSIYEGETLKGRVNDVFMRGPVVLQDNSLQPSAVGTGRYVHRALPGNLAGRPYWLSHLSRCKLPSSSALAPRRGFREDQRGEALPLACRRS